MASLNIRANDGYAPTLFDSSGTSDLRPDFKMENNYKSTSETVYVTCWTFTFVYN